MDDLILVGTPAKSVSNYHFAEFHSHVTSRTDGIDTDAFMMITPGCLPGHPDLDIIHQHCTMHLVGKATQILFVAQLR